MKRRVLSLALAICLCLAVLPSSAFAAEEEFIIENGVLLEYKGPGGNIVIPEGVIEISGSIFEDETAATVTSITLPSTLTKLGQFAFARCSSLTSITIPANVTYVDWSVVNYCYNLADITFLGEGYIEIEYGAFSSRGTRQHKAPSLVFHGYSGSWIEQYANKMHHPFIPIPGGSGTVWSDRTTSPKPTLANFTDVDSNTMSWAGDSLAWGLEKGVINGKGNGRMDPGSPLTVAEFLTMVQRLLLTDKDRDELDYRLDQMGWTLYERGHWAAKSMAYAQQIGIDDGLTAMSLDGYGWESEMWDTPITRERMALILFNATLYLGESKANPDWLFKDITDWESAQYTRFSCAILQCWAKGLVDGVGDNRFDPKGLVTRASGVVAVRRLVEPSLRSPMRDGSVYAPPGFVSDSIDIREGLGYQKGLVENGEGLVYMSTSGDIVTLRVDPTTKVLGWGQLPYMDYWSNSVDFNGETCRIGTNIRTSENKLLTI